MQSYRAPISSQGPRIEPFDLLRGGFLRSGPSDDDGSVMNPNQDGSSSQQRSGGGRRSGNGSGETGNGLEHHVDIHIAILSPSPANTSSSSSSS